MIRFYPAIRPLLFSLDPERAHRLAMSAVVSLEWVLAQSRTRPRPWSHPALSQQLWGIEFANPVGLAAGFDKDARAPHVWPLLGFGFAELGTVTAHAQPGNPLPRMFRLARDQAVINRLGFNNSGAAAVAARLSRLLQRAEPAIPLGINLGKSRLTPLEQAPADYVESLRQIFALAAYVVINISSPNTPGLRDLQAEEHLTALLAVLTRENQRLAQASGQVPRPLLVKVAPDLNDEALLQVVRVAQSHQVAGLVATNTTIRRDGLSTTTEEGGGLSGRPLRQRATEVIRILRRAAGPELPIIGVGGVFCAADAYEKIRAGAWLVQLYTGLIFEGPRLPARIAQGLVHLLQRDGFQHLREAVGSDA